MPHDGFTGGNHSLATGGPMCRDAADARLLGEALLASPLEPRPTRGLRIGVPRARLWNDLDPEVEAACTRAVEALQVAGVEIQEVTLDGLEHAVIATVLALSLEGAPSNRPSAVAELEPHLSPLIKGLTKYQLLTPALAFLKAGRVRAQLRRSIAQAFGSVDALAWPTLPAPAPPVEHPTVTLPSGDYPADFVNVRLGGIANLAGTPAISVPCGISEEGLPIGLQLLAPWGEDARLLDLAELLEEATERRHVDAVPPLAQAAAA
jgi:aspartyl-tRNA(Asn)/glutamyl-tRNA(Gln) amidotransferase subunit A